MAGGVGVQPPGSGSGLEGAPSLEEAPVQWPQHTQGCCPHPSGAFDACKVGRTACSPRPALGLAKAALVHGAEARSQCRGACVGRGPRCLQLLGLRPASQPFPGSLSRKAGQGAPNASRRVFAVVNVLLIYSCAHRSASTRVFIIVLCYEMPP